MDQLPLFGAVAGGSFAVFGALVALNGRKRRQQQNNSMGMPPLSILKPVARETVRPFALVILLRMYMYFL